MSLEIIKDPKKRLGGWALVILPAGASGETLVEIQRPDTAEFLGPHGWQGTAHSFGPYQAEESRKGPALRIGPEIVNHMEAYLAFHLSAPGFSAESDLTWPESIPPAPGGGKVGGLGRVEDDPEPAPRQPAPAAPPPVAEPEPEPAPPLVAEPKLRERKSGGRSGLFLLLIPLLLIIAAAAWWFMREEPSKELSKESALKPDQVCDAESITALFGDQNAGAGALHAMADLCAGDEAQDLQVRVLERLASTNDPKALMQFAKWYDPREEGPTPFGSRDLGTAADYYSRAAAAGDASAKEALAGFCADLRNSTDPMASALVSIHCK